MDILAILFIIFMCWFIDGTSRTSTKHTESYVPKADASTSVYHRGYCVYCIYDGDWSYIGVTSSLRRRKLEHLAELSANEHTNYKLQESYNAGTITNQSFTLVKDNLTEAEAYALELKLVPHRNVGMNIIAGGTSSNYK